MVSESGNIVRSAFLSELKESFVLDPVEVVGSFAAKPLDHFSYFLIHFLKFKYTRR